MTPEQTIGSIVANDYRTADVFSKMKIDFCCKGGRSIAEVCLQKGIQPDVLINALADVQNQPKSPASEDVSTWSATALADYIEQHHHKYVREATPVLAAYLKKIASVHGGRHPELLEIFAQFTESSTELLQHMIKEETILFPAIRKMESMLEQHTTMDKPFFFGTVENPIAMMRREHETEGDRFAAISALSNNYTAPEDGCTTYRVAFAKLQEFEADLHRHIHLENNILFHKAVALEARLKMQEAGAACAL